MKEVCQNPWKRKKCKNTDIAIYIYYNNRRLPICRSCWKQIARSDKEWRNPELFSNMRPEDLGYAPNPRKALRAYT